MLLLLHIDTGCVEEVLLGVVVSWSRDDDKFRIFISSCTVQGGGQVELFLGKVFLNIIQISFPTASYFPFFTERITVPLSRHSRLCHWPLGTEMPTMSEFALRRKESVLLPCSS